MAYIEQVEIDNTTGETQKLFQMSMERTGRVANIIRVMGQDGKSASASMGLYVSIMKSPNALTGAQREMLASVVSNVNDCFY